MTSSTLHASSCASAPASPARETDRALHLARWHGDRLPHGARAAPLCWYMGRLRTTPGGARVIDALSAKFAMYVLDHRGRGVPMSRLDYPSPKDPSKGCARFSACPAVCKFANRLKFASGFCNGNRDSTTRLIVGSRLPGHLQRPPTCCLPGCLTAIPTRFVSRNPAFPRAVPSGTRCDQEFLSAVARHDISSEKMSSGVRLYTYQAAVRLSYRRMAACIWP